jgi:hypothetical protein
VISHKQFEFFRGDQLLGTVVVERLSFPWTIGKLSPAPPYETVRHLFDEAWNSSIAEDWDRCDPILEEIENPGLTLRDTETNEVHSILGFHCNGTEFHWLEDAGPSNE